MELKELPEIRGCQSDRIFYGFSDFQKKIEFLNCGFQDFWISSFFWISSHISGTKRATGDPRVSKRPGILRALQISQNNRIFGFLYFCIFSYFLPYLRNVKSYRRSAGVKTTRFFRAFQISKKIKFVDFWIFCLFLAVSWERKERPEIHWCQNDQIF